jgi:serine/threonine-protein kinase
MKTPIKAPFCFLLLFLLSFNVIAQNTDALLKKALNNIQLRNYKGAIEDCNTIIKLEPNSPEGYYCRGVAKNHLHDFNGCIADESKAIQLDPTFEMAYYMRGVAYGNIQNYKASVLDLDKAIKADPTIADAFFFRGKAKYFLADYTGAVSDLNKSLKLEGNHETYNLLGLCKHQLSDYQGAIEAYKSAIALNARFADPYMNRATSLIKLGKMSLACDDLNKAYTLGLTQVKELLAKYCK